MPDDEQTGLDLEPISARPADERTLGGGGTWVDRRIEKRTARDSDKRTLRSDPLGTVAEVTPPPVKPEASRMRTAQSGRDGTATRLLEPPRGGRVGGAGLQQTQLINPSIVRLLMPDVFPNLRFVAARCRHEVAARPKLLLNEVPFALCIRPHDMNRALPLDAPNNLRDGVLWGKSRSAYARDRT